MLGLDGLLALLDERLAAVALGEHPLLPDRGGLADLAAAGGPDPPAAGDGDAAERLRQLVDRVDDPGVGEQRPREREGGPAAANPLESAAQPPAGVTPGAAAAAGGIVRRDERTAPVVAGAIKQRRRRPPGR